MPDPPTEFAHLTLSIQHLLDAEQLLESEATGLLAEAEAARQAWEQGDRETGRRHLAAVAGLTEALIRSGVLAPVDGQAVLRAAHSLLHRDGDSPA